MFLTKSEIELNIIKERILEIDGGMFDSLPNKQGQLLGLKKMAKDLQWTIDGLKSGKLEPTGSINEWIEYDKENNTSISRDILGKHWDINTEFDWYNCDYEIFIEKAKKIGFIISPEDISFSGFWSQGDGASFTGYVDVAKYILANKLGNRFRKALNMVKNGDLGNINIARTSSNYVHSNTCKIEDDYEHEVALDSLYDMLEVTRKELCEELYNSLRSTYDYLSSDEVVIETLEANEYEFDMEGEIV